MEKLNEHDTGNEAGAVPKMRQTDAKNQFGNGLLPETLPHWRIAHRLVFEATEGQMKFMRSTLYSTRESIVIVPAPGNAFITITGPSRESVAQKILAMEQVVGALRGVLKMQTGAMQAHMESPPEALAQCDCRFCCLNKARAALLALEGKT